MIRIHCPGCGREQEYSDYLAGMTVKCRNCPHPIPIPYQLSATPPVAEPKPSAPKFTPLPPVLAAPVKQREEALRPSPPADSAPPPGWAFDKARALMQTGISVPDSEKRLVAQGLSPAGAAAVVEQVLGDRVKIETEAMARADRRRFLHRLCSAIVAVVYISLAFGNLHPYRASRVTLGVITLTAIIWFPDVFGRFIKMNPFTETSLGILVRWLAWLVLSLPIIGRVIIVIVS